MRSRRITWIDVRPVLADLRHAEREEVLPALARDDDAQPAGVVAQLAAPLEARRAHHAQQLLEVVEHLDGRRRVVHRRRQRPDRDVDHDPDGEAGVLVDRPLDAEGDEAAELPLGVRRDVAVDLHQHAARGDEVADRLPQDEHAVVLVAPSGRVPRRGPPGSRPPLSAVTRSAGAPSGMSTAATGAVVAGDSSSARAAGLRDERGDRDRTEAVHEPVEEEQEEQDPDDEEEAGQRDAEIRDEVRRDAAQQRERERQRPDDDGERRLQQPVAIPEAHVARRERPRRHLHDEHADRDDEPGQRGGRADDRREERGRRRGRVVPDLGHVDVLVEVDGDRAEHGAEQRADQRQQPEAALRKLPRPEGDSPHAAIVEVRCGGRATTSSGPDEAATGVH